MSRSLTPITLEAVEIALRQRCLDYFPDFRNRRCQLRLVQHRSRAFNVLAYWDVYGGRSRQRLITKWNHDLVTEDSSFDRDPAESYLVPGPDRPGAEWQAMRRVEDHLSRRRPSRLFSVKVHDSLLNDRVLVLERATAQPLSRMYRRSALASPGFRRRVLQATERSAEWLREFHGLHIHPSSRLRGATRVDFHDWTVRVSEVLKTHLSAAAADTLRNQMLDLSSQYLPNRLPVAPLHDDFAPRNLLIDRANRVAGIDTTMEWKGCQWEDLARFVVALATDKLRMASDGILLRSAWVDQLEAAFYRSYYGDQCIP